MNARVTLFATAEVNAWYTGIYAANLDTLFVATAVVYRLTVVIA